MLSDEIDNSIWNDKRSVKGKDKCLLFNKSNKKTPGIMLALISKPFYIDK